MLEVIVFCVVYLFGAQGIWVLKTLQQENAALVVHLREVEHQVQCLKNDALAWQTDNFKKEKLAREHLQMARQDDQIVVLEGLKEGESIVMEGQLNLSAGIQVYVPRKKT